MAGKAIQIIAGGVGVASAAPFTAGQYTIITAAPAPTITAGRLGQLGDAVQSIVAPDVTAPADLTSMALGSAATTRGALGSLVIGSAVKQTGAAGQGVKSVLIGGNIDPGAAGTSRANIVYIGWDFTLTDGGSSHGSNVFIGQSISTGGGTDVGASVVIGTSIVQQGGDCVTIGQSSLGAFGESVVVGMGALSSQSQTVAIGKGANGGTNSVSVGRRARSDQSSVAVGFFADSLGDSGVSIGRDTSNGGFNTTIVLGRGSTCGVANSIIAGNNTYYYELVQIGAAYTGNGTPRTLLIRTTSAQFGANDAEGWTMQLQGGVNTGNKVTRGDVQLLSGTRLGSGSTYQTPVERLAVVPGGATGFPSIRLTNQISTPGVAAATLLNAPVVGDPALWIELTVNGVLHYLPVW